MKTQILAMNEPDALERALEILRGGGQVAFPTDTVYGVGALAFDGLAAAQIYEIKDRPPEKALPVLLGDLAQLPSVAAEVSAMCRTLARKFWPGALTIVVPRQASIPASVSPLATVGVRIPNFAPTIELLRRAGPMAVTSANLSGQASPSTAEGVRAQLGGRIPLILDGGVTPGGVPSTVVDCSGPQPVILRAGPITLEQILAALSSNA
jgi:L-threonylcarbamoyladenylate synthase